MTKTGWIAVAVGVVGAGALALFKLGKRAAIPSYQDGTTSFPFEEVTASTPQGIVEQAEVATEVAAKAAAQQVQLTAEKANLEQQATVIERELNSVLSEQTPDSIAQAQALDVERQSLLARMAANDAAMTQAVATSDAAQQSIDSAAKAMADALEREQVITNAQANAAADKVARDLEKSRQEQATAALGTEPAKPYSPDRLPQSELDKWAYVPYWVERTFTAEKGPSNISPDQFYKTASNKLKWFADIEKYISDFSANNPGFSAWFTQNHATLINLLTIEKKRVLGTSAPMVGDNASQPKDNEDKWQQAADVINQLWMTDYPKRVTNAARLEWFVQLEKGIAETEKRFPGFNAWLISTNKGLLSKMASEKKKVAMEVPSVDPKLVVWKTASVLTLDYWTKKYSGQTDKEKAQGLIAIVNATKATEQAAPGYMKWFEATYPGVSAKMMAEGSRLQNVSVPGSGALTANPAVETKSVSKDIVNAYTQLLGGWEAYKKLTDENQRKTVMTATLAASVTPQGKLVWAYAQSVNPSFVAAVTAEAARLSQAPKAGQVAARPIDLKPQVVGVGARPVQPQVGAGARPVTPTAGAGARPVPKSNVATVINSVTQANALRSAAKVLTAANNTQAIKNKLLVRVMGN
jgi:hypothetical protein